MKPDTVEAKLSNIHYGKWTHSNDDERWPLTEGFDTKEEAVAAGKFQYEHSPFWVGVMAKPIMPGLNGYDITDRLMEAMGDSESAFEGRDSWPQLTDAEESNLEALVNDTIFTFLTKTGKLPDWFMVEQSELIT